MRTATVERKTRETEIAVSLDLDGTGECDIDTGIGFLDHMLESFGRHSMMDLRCGRKATCMSISITPPKTLPS